MKLKNGLTSQQTARCILLSAVFQAEADPAARLGFDLTARQEEELLRHMNAEYARIEKMFAAVKEKMKTGEWHHDKAAPIERRY